MGTLGPSTLPYRGPPRRLAAAAAAVALLSCGARSHERLVIGLPRLPSNTLLFLAADANHARDEGLDLVFEYFPTGKDALAAALDGKVDAAAAYETPIVFEAFKGAPVRILTTLHTSTRSIAVVARADRGVKGADDLSGRRVGVARGTNAEFFLRTILASSGLRWDEAQIVDVQVADFATALASGRVDALATWSPFVERIERDLGPGRATVLHSDVYAEVSMLVAPAATLAARRPALEALMRALVRAERAAAERPDAAFATLRARLPEGERADARQSFDHLSLRLGISNALVASLRSESEWLVAEGLANAIPDFRPLLVPELLDAVDPEAVTLEEPPVIPHQPATSLRQALLVPAVGFAVVAVGALGSVAVLWAAQSQRFEREVAAVRQTNALVLDLTQRQAEAQRAVLAYRYRPDPRARGEIEGRQALIGATIARISALELPARGRAIWSDYVSARAAQLAAGQALLDAVESPRDRYALAFDRWALVTGRTSALLADLAVWDVKRLNRAVSESDAQRKRTLAALAATLLAAAGALLVLAARINGRVVRPLLAMSAVATRIAEEQTALPVAGAEREDEIGTLARALNDMTAQLVEGNEKLVGALATRDEFLSIASHELKTPLTSLKLQLDGAAHRAAAHGEAPPWIATAQRQVRRLDALIGQLLDVSRIRAGRLALDVSETDLAQVVGTVLERFGPELERAGNSIRLELADGATGRWDAGRLDQVVTNLLTNAVKYAPGTPVSVRVRAADGRAVLEVEDGGAGVPAALREHVFDPYERGATPRAVGGLGLGLFIVRQVVEAHGGTVSVEPGRAGGARFVVELPRGGAPQG